MVVNKAAASTTCSADQNQLISPNALAFGKADWPPEFVRGARAALERTKMSAQK